MNDINKAIKELLDASDCFDRETVETILTALRDKQTTTSEGDLLALRDLDIVSNKLSFYYILDDVKEEIETIRQALTRPTKDIVDVEEACKAIVFDSMHRSGLNQEPNKWSTADIYEGGRRMYYHLSEQGHLSTPKKLDLSGLRKSYSMRDVNQEHNEGYNQALDDVERLQGGA